MAVGRNVATKTQPKGLAIEFLSDFGQAGLMGSGGHENTIAWLVCRAVKLIRWKGNGFRFGLAVSVVNFGVDRVKVNRKSWGVALPRGRESFGSRTHKARLEIERES